MLKQELSVSDPAPPRLKGMNAKSNKPLRAVAMAVFCLAVGAATSSLTRAEAPWSSDAVADAPVRHVVSRQSYNSMLEQVLVGMENVNPQLKATMENGEHDASLAAVQEALP